MKIKLKSEKEILERLRDLVQRHQKRYVRTRMKPKGSNCLHKVFDEATQEWFCSGCGSTDPDVCLNHSRFEPEQTVAELKQAFREDVCNTQRMLRDYRDLAVILWVLSQFDDPGDYEATKDTILGITGRQNSDTLLEHRSIPNTLEPND